MENGAFALLKISWKMEGVDRGGGGTGIEGAESGVEGAESGVEGAGVEGAGRGANEGEVWKDWRAK